MASDKQCIDYVREWLAAGLPESPELREQLLDMAREWMAVALAILVTG
jgi:hypothetical protein